MSEFIACNNRYTIPLGWQGENITTEIKFPISSWEEEYGSGDFELVARRPTEKTKYPVPVEKVDGFAIWTVRDVDVAYRGNGECQLTLIVGGMIKKSVIFTTEINRSLTGDGKTPEPYQDWVDSVLQAGAEAKEAANEAAGSAQTALLAKEGAEEAADQAREQAEYAAGIMGLAVFEIDTGTGQLYITYPTPYYGAAFAINNNGYLEVTT